MRLTRVWQVVALAVVVAGCGYALVGKYSTLPAHIKRIGVPTFQNLSTTADLDRIFTDAIRRELISRGRFTIVQEATGVDAVLTGSIRLDTPVPVAFTTGERGTKYSIMVIGAAEFKQTLESKVLWNDTLRVMEEYDLPAGGAGTDLAALFVQDRNAIERLAKAFAEKLVAAILEAS